MMADVMYYVLTKRWMFEGKTSESAKELVELGKRPTFPLRFKDTKDPAVLAMIEAIMRCWTHDPEQRPSSREISDYLNESLRKIQGVDKLGVVRVSVPALPKDHRYSDSDFYENLLA